MVTDAQGWFRFDHLAGRQKLHRLTETMWVRSLDPQLRARKIDEDGTVARAWTISCEGEEAFVFLEMDVETPEVELTVEP